MSYKLTHPESKQTIEVAKDMAAVYQTQGWVAVATRAPSPEPEPEPEKKSTPKK